jgi:cell division transport system permease protein
MAQSHKGSARRGKPSYVMSIIGVTLVLFLLGLVGWLVINANKLGDYFRENVEVRAFLRGDISKKDSVALMEQIASRPYVKDYEFVDKETAKKKYLQNNNEDWSKVLDYNPLPNSVNFHLKRDYVELDSLKKISEELRQNVYISEVQYPEAVVSNLNKNIQRISYGLLGVALIIAISVIFLIDNTIRLAMFSNRFLIKTMQMVGATRWFIARPLNTRAIINGAISAAIAIVLVYAVVTTAQNYWPDLAVLHDTKMLILLFLGLLLIGISITFISTYRSVLKYLRMKLDDLY